MADPPDAQAQWERRIQARLADGEAAALGELYDRCAHLVHSLAVRLLVDEKAARELVTEVFSHLWQHPEAFDPARAPLSAWLAAQTHERATARLSSDGHRAGADVAPPPPENPENPENPADRADPDDRAEPSASARAESVLSSMPISLRAALHLAYARKMNYRQVAAELGITDDEACRRLRLSLQLVAAGSGLHRRDGR
ncbi:sigma-70 family RNA polymerase sigma factor [Streptomyces sp. CA-111067]|uniref:sigma-70 family RNA polymerase sigma factor n=1 Tax=Streptomyces sp. CA-111067 TaxID=3240046 RepID=UPI003D959FCC